MFLALAAPAAQARTAAPATTLSTSEISLLNAVNGVRASHNLRPLQLDHVLVRAARDYSTDLIRRNALEHGALGSRLASYGARGPLYGENLGWAAGTRAPARRILAGWLASPAHRANLLRPGFRRIGIGASVGSFSGFAGATVVTADFAGR